MPLLTADGGLFPALEQLYGTVSDANEDGLGAHNADFRQVRQNEVTAQWAEGLLDDDYYLHHSRCELKSNFPEVAREHLNS